MKSLGLLLLVAGLVLALSPATAANTVTLTSHDKGGSNFVYVDASNNENPTINVPPSTQITITIAKGTDNAGTPHNFHVMGGGVDQKSEDIANAGDTATVTFTTPASGDINYMCDYHSTTMKGTIHVDSAATGVTTSGPAAAKKSPGTQVIGVTIAVIGAALLLRRK